LRAVARLSSRKPLLVFSGPWQRRHEVCRMGLMSRTKSIRLVAAKGSLDSSNGAAGSSSVEESQQIPETFAAAARPRRLARRGSSLRFFHRAFNTGNKVEHSSRESRDGSRPSNKFRTAGNWNGPELQYTSPRRSPAQAPGHGIGGTGWRPAP
jgi:hypothetical protein